MTEYLSKITKELKLMAIVQVKKTHVKHFLKFPGVIVTKIIR